MNYKLNVADEDGIFLGYVLVSVDSENTEAYNITKPMARSAVMMDIEELIEAEIS